ncbi:MAG: NAD(P)H-hydrate dehydratase [Yoonia sp.]
MTELLTAAQMRAIEQAAIASGEVTGLELMERAGRGVVEAIFAEWPDLAPSWEPAPKPPEFTGQDDKGHRAVVLCGPGNNGGDGFVVARLLKEAGWEVEVFLYGDAAKLPPDARVNYERWAEIGGVQSFEFGDDVMGPDDLTLVVDAFFGTGLVRPVEGFGSLFLSFAEERASRFPYTKIVSVDLPSAVCADSGRPIVLESFVGLPEIAAFPVTHAHLTVTFHKAKRGHYLSDGPICCGRLRVVDIGLDDFDQRVNVGQQKPALISKHERWPQYPSLPKKQGHKYSYGHALILSGGVGKGGAARLAARGALRVGAGAVTLGCPPAALIENAAQLNAIMLRAVKGVDGLDDALSDERINALCMGPGMGVSDESRDLIEAGLKSGRAMVLDADALTLIGRDAPLFALLHDKCVLTPHAGEFARLFPDLAAKLDAPATKGPAYSKVDATRAAAKGAGCVVLFKGPDTVIATPDGRSSINASVYERSAPWLATAGSGDVLAGFITGLLARGFASMHAAESGAWLHTECALSFGPGLIAEDLPDQLPKVFRTLGV